MSPFENSQDRFLSQFEESQRSFVPFTGMARRLDGTEAQSASAPVIEYVDDDVDTHPSSELNPANQGQTLFELNLEMQDQPFQQLVATQEAIKSLGQIQSVISAFRFPQKAEQYLATFIGDAEKLLVELAKTATVEVGTELQFCGTSDFTSRICWQGYATGFLGLPVARKIGPEDNWVWKRHLIPLTFVTALSEHHDAAAL